MVLDMDLIRDMWVLSFDDVRKTLAYNSLKIVTY